MVRKHEGKRTLGRLKHRWEGNIKMNINSLKPNDLKRRRTAQLTSRCCILYIYSTNIRIEYFKHAANSPFFLFKMPFIS